MPRENKVVLILIALLLICASIAVTGLTANNIAFFKNRFRNGENFVDVVFYRWSNSEQRGWDRHATIEYAPSNLTISDTQALLAAGVLGALFSTAVLAMIIWEKDGKLHLNITGRRARQVTYAGPLHIVAFNSLLVVTFLTVTTYGWQRFRNSAHSAWFDSYAIDLDNIVLATGTTHYRSGQHFVLETWNCALFEYVPANATSPSKSELRSLCQQATAARIMALPLLLLAALALGIHYWTWRRQNIATRGVVEGAGGQEQADDYDGEADAHARGERLEAGSAAIVELPSDHAKVLEVDGGALAYELPSKVALQELPGTNVWREVQSDEKPEERRSLV